MLNGWIDFNGNGIWTDPGEQFIFRQPVVPGANVFDLTVPPDALVGLTFARFRLSSWDNLQPAGGAPDGEVEDYQIVISEPEDLDFGDAPDPTYPTLRVSDGARHGIVPGVYLGNLVDSEADGQPTISARGDDDNGLADEDGVVLTSQLIPGQLATMDVTASTAGILNAWIDGNLDGDWDDLDEQIVAGLTLSPGTNPVQVALPPGFSQGQTYARFRFSTEPVNTPGGLAIDGEVEDYRFTIGTFFSPQHPRNEIATAPSFVEWTDTGMNGPTEQNGWLDRGPQRAPLDGSPVDGVFLEWTFAPERWDTRYLHERTDVPRYARLLQADRRPAIDVAGVRDNLFARPDADWIFAAESFPHDFTQLAHQWH